MALTSAQFASAVFGIKAKQLVFPFEAALEFASAIFGIKAKQVAEQPQPEASLLQPFLESRQSTYSTADWWSPSLLQPFLESRQQLPRASHQGLHFGREQVHHRAPKRFCQLHQFGITHPAPAALDLRDGVPLDVPTAALAGRSQGILTHPGGVAQPADLRTNDVFRGFGHWA